MKLTKEEFLKKFIGKKIVEISGDFHPDNGGYLENVDFVLEDGTRFYICSDDPNCATELWIADEK